MQVLAFVVDDGELSCSNGVMVLKGLIADGTDQGVGYAEWQQRRECQCNAKVVCTLLARLSDISHRN